ncbi:MAG: hypothetical protein DWQ06_14835 [Calditrichaeota bacterium]|nr:MAG: hypothetical protein DWQ06_14835 [Calditrichota bacterium]
MIKKIIVKNQQCWWCGETSNLSGEHKFKATDIRRLYGKGKFNKENMPYLIKDGCNIPLQSANSNFLKFNKCICKKCNNDRSSDFDLSYDIFIEYVIKNKLKISSDSYLDLAIIFGEKWSLHLDNLLRYFTKQLGCQTATGNYEVSSSIKKFLNQEYKCSNDLKFLFELRTQNLSIEKIYKAPILYLSNFSWTNPNKIKQYVQSLSGWYTISNVSINYLYQKDVSLNSMLTNKLEGSKLILSKIEINNIDFEIDFRDARIAIPYFESLGKNETNKTLFEFLKKMQKRKQTN